jgi:hypothetical protein
MRAYATTVGVAESSSTFRGERTSMGLREKIQHAELCALVIAMIMPCSTLSWKGEQRAFCKYKVMGKWLLFYYLVNKKTR